MSASAVYTTATVQPRVQTLLDPSTVLVTILLPEMEKRAISWQVNVSCCDPVLLWNKCDKLDISRLCEEMKFGRLYFMVRSDVCQLSLTIIL